MAKKKKIVEEIKDVLKKRQEKKVEAPDVSEHILCRLTGIDSTIIDINNRIDAIVAAHDKCKSLKGL